MCYLFIYQYIYENVIALIFSPGFPHSQTAKSQSLILPDGLRGSVHLGHAVYEWGGDALCSTDAKWQELNLQ